jgi:hypothetical protein
MVLSYVKIIVSSKEAFCSYPLKIEASLSFGPFVSKMSALKSSKYTIDLPVSSVEWLRIANLVGKPEIVGIKYEIPAGQKLGWHHHPVINHGENRGTQPVVLYMFYLSQEGLPLSVQHPEIPLK